MSLFWRVFGVNAALFVAGTVAVGLFPAQFSFSRGLTEAVVLVGGLTAMLIVNLLLVRLIFVPLDRLRQAMRNVDLLHPGERLSVLGPGEVGELVAVFNEMLDRLESERRDSGRRSLAAQEAERKRVARELHDEIGQDLTAVLLELSRLVKRVPEHLRPELVETQEIARSSLDDLRRIVRQLRPEALDDLGLVSALTSLSTAFSERTGIPVDRRLARELPWLGPEVQLVLYRVAQESLTNIARHAGASRALLGLERTAGGIMLRVADDGCGLNGAADGSGILGMRERALLVGGDLAIASRQGGGVEVRLAVPLEQGTA